MSNLMNFNHQIIPLKISYDFGGRQNEIYPVILKDHSEVVLIDCGYPNFLPLIEACAKTHGIGLEAFTKIVITHHDFDHMGALADLKEAYPQVGIVASMDDAPYISGQKKSLRLEQAEALYAHLPESEKEGARQFHQLLASVQPVEVDQVVKDGERLSWGGGVEIIHTPGHMSGHISIYHQQSKTLIAGDALVIEDGELAIANPQYTLDLAEAKRSIEKLLKYNIEYIICYHGGLFELKDKEALERLTK